ncbi:retropepsin-like aspartic protease [Brevundimonas sp. SORGH_AS_0993]|uniref:retropepsin-like aspartic protease n=1 Tax=Brevundimonas sp. SORGH_AS_0993 TaxID=3041794 RepID=UPI00277F5970|nr:retropepsin-like aspartic protease [Brevundimonas sp. SORGH_AS_0993]MDQ1154843.1 hypothetical protein [Brevundimonas sp. SORGH_AS_0993]
MRPSLIGSGSGWRAAIPSRRDALALTAALPLGAWFLTASPAAAQTQAEATTPAPETLRLFRNLLTRMGVGVRLNGGPERTFIIDTGAERSAVSRELALALGLPPGPDVMVHGVTAAEATPTVHVEAVEVGRRRFPALELPVFPRQALGADGLLGLDLLSRFRLVLDVQARRALLTRPGEGVSVGGAGEIGARRQADLVVSGRRGPSGQLILGRLVVDGVETSAFIDSGAQYSIGNLALMRAARIAPETDPGPPDPDGGHRGRRRFGSDRRGPRPEDRRPDAWPHAPAVCRPARLSPAEPDRGAGPAAGWRPPDAVQPCDPGLWPGAGRLRRTAAPGLIHRIAAPWSPNPAGASQGFQPLGATQLQSMWRPFRPGYTSPVLHWPHPRTRRRRKARNRTARTRWTPFLASDPDPRSP